MKTINSNKLYALNRRLKVDLSLGTNPLGCSPMVVKTLKSISPTAISDYPDFEITELKEKIADKFTVNPEQIFVSNGSDSIIKLISRAFIMKNIDEVIIPEVSFPLFRISVKETGGMVILSKMTKRMDIDLKDMKNKISKRTKLVFICNPNNPTGMILGKQTILDFIKSTDIPVVVDEANIEFGGKTVIRNINKINNLIVLRTFSKGFGLAGLRIGFCIGQPRIITRLERVSLPFSVSSLALRAAVSALEDEEFIARTREFVKKERLFMTKELQKKGIFVSVSHTNFLFVKVNDSIIRINDFFNRLAEKDISVVNGRHFSNKTGKFFRMSLKTRKINRLFLRVIDEIY